MDSTTEMQVSSILRNEYHRQHQTLGEGGWAKIPRDWRNIFLVDFRNLPMKGKKNYIGKILKSSQQLMTKEH